MRSTQLYTLLATLFIAAASIFPMIGCSDDAVTVESTTFTMGSPAGEFGHEPDEAQHQVTLSHDFEIMETEVTQRRFEDVMGYNPGYFPVIGSGTNRPVEQVSWFDALAFTNRLSLADGFTPCYTLTDIVCTDETPGNSTEYCMDHGGINNADVALNGAASVYTCEGYRLPTEAEWEYAARAGTTTAHYNGDVAEIGCSPLDRDLDEIAWYCGNIEPQKRTFPVGGKAPNAWGLHDMIGNVAEWCWDWYAADYPGTATDPEGPAEGHFRTVRGGSIKYDGAVRCRSAHRAGYAPDYRTRYVGFRPVRTTSEASPGAEEMVPVSTNAANARPAAVEATVHDYPDSLPFAYTREDVGEALTPAEVTAFTRKITAFWDEVQYFHWILWHSHGMDASNPYGMPDYKLFWQDTQAIKDGDVVTFEHRGGADNLMIRTSKVYNNAAAGYLMSGDATMGRVVEQYSKGFVAQFQGMLWAEEDPESYLMPRAIFTQDHSYTEEGREAYVDYGPVKHEVINWNAHTIPNPTNPHWGDMWVRNMRSKDDVPHMFRSVPMMMRVIEEGADESVRAAAALALEYMLGFTRDIVDSGYYIRTKDKRGNAYIPLNDDTGLINDLASFVEYTAIVPDAECDPRLNSVLLAYGDPLDVDCGNGIGVLYEWVATSQHYFNYAIIRYFHVSTITAALMAGQNDIAYTLMEGLTERVEGFLDCQGPNHDHRDWPSDAASYLLVAATAGLPLTSEEARYVMEHYSLAVDHYETWPNWDIWDPSVPNGEIEYKPSRNGPLGTVVRPTELTYLLEYCYSPFRNEAGAELVDCDIIGDPTRWGGE